MPSTPLCRTMAVVRKKVAGWVSRDSETACVQNLGRKGEDGDLCLHCEDSPIPEINTKRAFQEWRQEMLIGGGDYARLRLGERELCRMVIGRSEYDNDRHQLGPRWDIKQRKGA